MNGPKSGSLTSVPNGRIIDFETAELRRVPFQDSLYLWVCGQLPASGFEAKLAPRVYHDRPDYWGIEVAVVTIVRTAASVLTIEEHANDAVNGDRPPGDPSLLFERSIPLIGITGFRGIAVIGANSVKRIDIPGGML